MGDDEWDDEFEEDDMEWDFEQAVLAAIEKLPPRIALAYHIVNYSIGVDKRLIQRSNETLARYIIGELGDG